MMKWYNFLGQRIESARDAIYDTTHANIRTKPEVSISLSRDAMNMAMSDSEYGRQLSASMRDTGPPHFMGASLIVDPGLKDHDFALLLDGYVVERGDLKNLTIEAAIPPLDMKGIDLKAFAQMFPPNGRDEYISERLVVKIAERPRLPQYSKDAFNPSTPALIKYRVLELDKLERIGAVKITDTAGPPHFYEVRPTMLGKWLIAAYLRHA